MLLGRGKGKRYNTLILEYQVGPMLVTHWGLSGPVILRLSAWGARYLSSSDYKGDECRFKKSNK